MRVEGEGETLWDYLGESESNLSACELRARIEKAQQCEDRQPTEAEIERYFQIQKRYSDEDMGATPRQIWEEIEHEKQNFVTKEKTKE